MSSVLICEQLIIITDPEDQRGPIGAIILEQTFVDNKGEYVIIDNHKSHDWGTYLSYQQKYFLIQHAKRRLESGEIGRGYHDMIVRYLGDGEKPFPSMLT